MGLSILHEIQHSRCSRGTFLSFPSPRLPFQEVLILGGVIP